MSDQVWKYDTPEEYLDPYFTGGEPMSDKLSAEEAEAIRDKLRKEDPDHCYFLRHYGSVRLITLEQRREHG